MFSKLLSNTTLTSALCNRRNNSSTISTLSSTSRGVVKSEPSPPNHPCLLIFVQPSSPSLHSNKTWGPNCTSFLGFMPHILTRHSFAQSLHVHGLPTSRLEPENLRSDWSSGGRALGLCQLQRLRRLVGLGDGRDPCVLRDHKGPQTFFCVFSARLLTYTMYNTTSREFV